MSEFSEVQHILVQNTPRNSSCNAPIERKLTTNGMEANKENTVLQCNLDLKEGGLLTYDCLWNVK
jgi:hypothetical protein